MQMRINLDQILGSSKEDTLQSSMYSSSRTSELGSSKSQKVLPKISYPIFVDQQQLVQKSQHDVKSIKSKTPSVSSKQTESYDKNPGERLYYQSKATLARKKEQIQKKKLDSMQEEQKNMTFKPQINKNSKKIIETMVKSPKINQKQLGKEIPTQIKKFQQQIMQCTFKPELVSKSPYGQTRYKQKGKVFEQLFNNHKFKKIKQKIDEQLYMPQQRHPKKDQFQSFLARNNQYKIKVQKKKQLITITSTIYDLKTGNKLFSPQTKATEYLQKVASSRNKGQKEQGKYLKSYKIDSSKKAIQKQAKQVSSMKKLNQQQVSRKVSQNHEQEKLNVIQQNKQGQQQNQQIQKFEIKNNIELNTQNKKKADEQTLEKNNNQQSLQSQPQHQQQNIKPQIKLQAQIEQREKVMRDVIQSVVFQDKNVQKQNPIIESKQEIKQEHIQSKNKQISQAKELTKKNKKNFKSLMKNKSQTHKNNQQADQTSSVDANQEMKVIEEEYPLKDSKSTVVEDFQNNSLKKSKIVDPMKIEANQLNEQTSQIMKLKEKIQMLQQLQKIDQKNQLKGQIDQ